MPVEEACGCYCANNHDCQGDVRIKMSLYLHNGGNNNEGEEQNAGKNDLFRRNLFHYVSLMTIKIAFL